MEFPLWRKWSGAEVAQFVATICELPQYRAVIKVNLTGPVLEQLLKAGMLLNALARAGVSDYVHQKKIRAALVSLASREPEELQQEFQAMRVLTPPAKPWVQLPPPSPPDKPRQSQGFRHSQYGLARSSQLPPVDGAAGPRMTLPPLAVPPTPRNAEAYESSKRQAPQLWQQPAPLQLPQKDASWRLVTSRAQYESMSGGDAATTRAASRRLGPGAGAAEAPEAARASKREHAAAAAPEAAQASKKEHAAATRIQSRHRGAQARGRAEASLAELRAQHSAAAAEASAGPAQAPTVVPGGREALQEEQQVTIPDAIPEPQDRRPAATEVEKASEDLHLMATRIQALHRGRQARQEVTARRTASEGEKRQSAAVRIQALHRGRQARQEVTVRRTAFEQERRQVAATRIQALHRGKQARQEVTARRAAFEQERRQVAATRIQALHRGNQARRSVHKQTQ